MTTQLGATIDRMKMAWALGLGDDLEDDKPLRRRLPRSFAYDFALYEMAQVSSCAASASLWVRCCSRSSLSLSADSLVLVFSELELETDIVRQ